MLIVLIFLNKYYYYYRYLLLRRENEEKLQSLSVTGTVHPVKRKIFPFTLSRV